MAQEDIAKLRERVEKDPQSKLFVPLAEEYKKAGMLDEAIEVLRRGLEQQPNYMSARVSLGKIYLEKGMITEAQEEFERVIAAIPDNLFSHRKLSDIYYSQGNKAKAIEECNIILSLNSSDIEARNLLDLLKDTEESREEATLKEAEGVSTEAVAPVEEEMQPMDILKEEVKSAIPEKQEGITPEVTTEDFQFPEGLSIRDNELEESKTLIFGKAEGIMEETEDVAIEEKGAFEEEPVIAEPIIEPVEEEASTTDEEDAIPTGTMADVYISQGYYDKALNIYREILGKQPDNRHILQRQAELKMLLRILGKGKEEVISRLDDFLEKIKRRGDELYRNT